MGKDLKGRELGKGLYQRKDGRYEAKATVNGIKIDIYDVNLTRLKTALKKAKEEAAQSIEIRFRKMTLNGWFEEWFTVYKVPYIKESSVYPMKNKFYNTFGKLIGDMNIQEVKNYHVQNAITTLMGEKRAVSSIREALGTLTKCMESARNNKIIEINPCFDIRIPWASKQVKRRFLTSEEQEKFLEAAENSWYKEMYHIMFNTGLRVGEVGGLKWCDVDFENKCFNINQALACDYHNGVKVQKLTTLKTPNSYRRIPFIGNVEEMLLSQKEKQKRIKKDLKSRYRSQGEFSDLVFCTTMGSPITRYVAEKEINKVVDAINYEESVKSVMEKRAPVEFEKVHPHALRHTFCSRCFEKGITPKVVQQLMGHAHYSTTIDIYTHVTEELMDGEVAKFSGLM